jgi:HSP20 family protein
MKMVKHRGWDRLFNLDNFFRDFWEDRDGLLPEMRRDFTGFKVDVYEKENRIHLDAELPGVKKEDISLTVDDGLLTVKAERKDEKEVKNDDYFFSERSYGSFQRSFNVGENIKVEDISAEYKDGVLHVTFEKPQLEKKETKKIEIK